MIRVKSVKLDGENIQLFNSAIYIFESNMEFTLELDMIVSEVAVKKYNKKETVITEIELEDGRLITSFMSIKALSGGLPQLNLIAEQVDHDEFADMMLVHENEAWFPNIEEGITLEEIRKVEMPFEDISLKLKLPIDQVEWLKEHNKKALSEIFLAAIYDYWDKNSIK